VRHWAVELEHAPDLMILLAAFVDRVARVGAKFEKGTKSKVRPSLLQSVVVVDSDDKPLRVNETAKTETVLFKMVTRCSRKQKIEEILLR
jgi:hypothetical protein